MQQYFVNEVLDSNQTVNLDKDILYHLIKVLRKDSSYIFRIVDKKGHVFLSHLLDDKRAVILEQLDENNELNIDITAILSLFKNDKFELCVQKLVELGVKRIVPFESSRSIVKGSDNKIARLNKIALEAAEQSHRNIIPEVTSIAKTKDLSRYLSDINYVAYESENSLNSNIKIDKSISFIIGPEGGFSIDEIKTLNEMGYESISLGKRILRAETAAIYMTSVIVSKCQ